MLSFNAFRAKAREIFGKDEYSTGTQSPIAFLYSLTWDIPNGPAFSEIEMARMNLALDERGCFGRALKATVLIEKNFPGETIQYGEVCEDYLRTLLVHGATSEKWHDNTYVAEILQYENPHSVIVCGGKQFDPIFGFLSDEPQKLAHPKVNMLDVWNGLYASYLISHGLLLFKENEDARSYLQFLVQAEQLCPGLLLPQENRASALCALGRLEESIAVAKQLAGKRKDAKMLFFLWILTEETEYREQIIVQYDVAMFNFLTKMFMP